jgi:uncharacterized membrane protein
MLLEQTHAYTAIELLSNCVYQFCNNFSFRTSIDIVWTLTSKTNVIWSAWLSATALNCLIKQLFDVLKTILVHRVYATHVDNCKIEDTASYTDLSVLVTRLVDFSFNLLSLL